MESVDECIPNQPFHTCQAKPTQLEVCTGGTVSGKSYSWAKRRQQTRPMASLPPRDQGKKCRCRTHWGTRTCCMIPTLLVLAASTLVLGYFVYQLQFPERQSCDVGRTCARVKLQDSENRNCSIDIHFAYDCRLQLKDSFGLTTTAILVDNNTLRVMKAGQYMIQSIVFIEGCLKNGSDDSGSPLNIYVAREPLSNQTTKVLLNYTEHKNFSHIYGLHNFDTADFVFVTFSTTVNSPASFLELIFIQPYFVIDGLEW
ncbi:hypothetical protein BgiMline_032880 [Biomphalaria glabrata]|uniref:Uncharacterized protein LOC106051391 isoform X2 n=1 Tax=Biomphalaria glabrata TaxID=6526 RepID=A0A9W2Z1D8_BIOGL|nr:uncharacterized protein LOC106051391 isoform X2 [Biomphalaria glabrata]KAI8751351.1 hypothetical protein BgiMline_015882 [Biomphalaria glabrata]